MNDPKKHPSSNSMEINIKKRPFVCLQVNVYRRRKFFFIFKLRHACIWDIILLSAWFIFASSVVATAAMSRRRHLLFVLNIFTVRDTQDFSSETCCSKIREKWEKRRKIYVHNFQCLIAYTEDTTRRYSLYLLVMWGEGIL